MKLFYGGLVTLLLILLGGSYPKIALSLAALILLSTVVLNGDKFKAVLDPNSYKN